MPESISACMCRYANRTWKRYPGWATNGAGFTMLPQSRNGVMWNRRPDSGFGMMKKWTLRERTDYPFSACSTPHPHGKRVRRKAVIFRYAMHRRTSASGVNMSANDGHYAGGLTRGSVERTWDMTFPGTPFIYVDLLKAAYEEGQAVNRSTIVGVNTYPSYQKISSRIRRTITTHCRGIGMTLPCSAAPECHQPGLGVWTQFNVRWAVRPKYCAARVADMDVSRAFFSFAEPGLWSLGGRRRPLCPVLSQRHRGGE